MGNVKNIDAKAYTDGQITTLTLHAPALLDTITELASAINNDPSYYTTITNQFATLNGLLSTSPIPGNTTGAIQTNLNINNVLNIGAVAPYYNEVAEFKKDTIVFYKGVYMNGSAVVSNYFRVYSESTSSFMFTVNAVDNLIKFGAPVLGNNGYIYNKDEIDTQLAACCTIYQLPRHICS